jgi:hypothetical protein
MAANYRATCRARSHRESVARLGVVIEEADEPLFRLELIGDLYPAFQKTGRLTREADQLTAIVVATRCTGRRRPATQRSSPAPDRLGKPLGDRA